MPFSYLISKNSIWACAGSSHPAFQVQGRGQFMRVPCINLHHPHLKQQLVRGVTYTWAHLLQHSRGNSTQPGRAFNNSVSEWNNPRCKSLSLLRAAPGWQCPSLSSCCRQKVLLSVNQHQPLHEAKPSLIKTGLWLCVITCACSGGGAVAIEEAHTALTTLPSNIWCPKHVQS